MAARSGDALPTMVAAVSQGEEVDDPQSRFERSSRRLRLDGRPRGRRAERDQQRRLNLLGDVPAGRMADLVRDDGGELRLGLEALEEAGVDEDLPPARCEGVDLGRRDDMKCVRKFRQVRVRDDPPADTLDGPLDAGIGIWILGLENGPSVLDPHLRLGLRRDQE